MKDLEPPENVEPLAGAERWPLVLSFILLFCGVVGTVAALMAGNPGGTIGLAVFVLAMGAVSVTWSYLSRRNYLRNKRNGAVTVRRPWRGENFSP